MTEDNIPDVSSRPGVNTANMLVNRRTHHPYPFPGVPGGQGNWGPNPQPAPIQAVLDFHQARTQGQPQNHVEGTVGANFSQAIEPFIADLPHEQQREVKYIVQKSVDDSQSGFLLKIWDWIAGLFSGQSADERSANRVAVAVHQALTAARYDALAPIISGVQRTGQEYKPIIADGKTTGIFARQVAFSQNPVALAHSDMVATGHAPSAQQIARQDQIYAQAIAKLYTNPEFRSDIANYRATRGLTRNDEVESVVIANLQNGRYGDWLNRTANALSNDSQVLSSGVGKPNIDITKTQILGYIRGAHASYLGQFANLQQGSEIPNSPNPPLPPPPQNLKRREL